MQPDLDYLIWLYSIGLEEVLNEGPINQLNGEHQYESKEKIFEDKRSKEKPDNHKMIKVKDTYNSLEKISAEISELTEVSHLEKYFKKFLNKEFNLDSLVLDLERLREKTNIEKAHFVGHSLGGMISPAYARKYPDRVLSVGMLSTVAARSDDDRNKIWKVINDLKTIGVKKTLENLTSRWFTDEFILKNPDLVSRRLNQVIDTDKDVFINVFKIYAETEMINWLNEIKKPCLLMTGENDGGCSPSHNKKMSNEIENSKLVIIPKVKHSFLIEAPDLVADNLLSFLN